MAESALVDLGFVPYEHQRDAHAKRKRFSVLVWHRRAGKTVFAIMELILAALACKRERGRFAYVGPLLGEAKDAAWEYLKHYTAGIPGRTVNESELWVKFPNGARVRVYGADNPDALRGGYFDGVVPDEVAQMKPEVWGEVVRPMLADRQGWALFIGTPKGVNLFSKLYYEAASKESEGWWSSLRRWRDTGVVPLEEIESARRSMSKAQFAQEFECDFAAAVSNALIDFSEGLAASRRAVPQREFEYSARIMGVDVARYGDDRTVICKRQGLMLLPLKVLDEKTDLMTAAGLVAREIKEWKPHAVFVDQGGIGAGVLDRLRQLGFNATGVDFGARPLDERFENRRAEMWWTMAEWVKTGCVPPGDNDLLTDLTAPTYTYRNARGRMQLESKDAIKERIQRSPDRGDAVALTFAEPVAAPERPEDAMLRVSLQQEQDHYEAPWERRA